MSSAAIALASLVLLAASPAAAAQEPETPPADDAVAQEARRHLAPVVERMADVRHVRARFLQEQESLLLADPIVSRGTLYLRASPATIVLSVEGERPVRVRSDATSHLVHHVTAKKAERFLFEENRLATALLSALRGDLDTLERAFDVHACREVEDEGSEDGEREATRRIEIEWIPHVEEVRARVRSLTLRIDPTRSVITGLTYETPDGESVTLSLTAIELDPPDWTDPAAAFTADLPPEVEVATRRIPPAGDGTR